MRDQRSVMAYNKTFKGIVIKAVSKIRLSVLYGFSVCSKYTYNILIAYILLQFTPTANGYFPVTITTRSHLIILVNQNSFKHLETQHLPL